MSGTLQALAQANPVSSLSSPLVTLGAMVLLVVVVRVGINHFISVVKAQKKAVRAERNREFRDRQRHGIFASYDRDKRLGRLPSQRRRV